jgi:hypothetical protein
LILGLSTLAGFGPPDPDASAEFLRQLMRRTTTIRFGLEKYPTRVLNDPDVLEIAHLIYGFNAAGITVLL